MMVVLATLFFTTVIFVIPVTITGSEELNGDIEHVGIREQTQSYDDSLVENKDIVPSGIDLPLDIDSDIVQVDNGQINSDDGYNITGDTKSDIIVKHEHIVPDVPSLTVGDGEATEHQPRQSVPAEGVEEGKVVDEELQQDLPDLWSDTGQFLPDFLDSPIRHEDPVSSLGIKVGSPSEEETVECPPPGVPVTPSLCGAPACLTHRHCRDPDTACCFNGCVHTCLRPLDAPAVIDWLEDTSLLLPMLDEAPGIPRFPMRYEGSSSIAYAQGGGEAVHLLGGCTITSHQYDQLKNFMTRTTIQDCSCTDGEVVCAVKPYKAEDE
ncbi:unnamed protein product [Meganyctiphanes norvegica]|uniref:WAP domain-containing protein n=1 Tax=Meganyctiphanes norvegica TaxID=48144 RepID=A0AAV2QZE3_MEGNR